MRSVTTKIDVLEEWFDANGFAHKPSEASIKIKNNFNIKQYRIILEVNGSKFCILKQDLVAAIENATNYSGNE